MASSKRAICRCATDFSPGCRAAELLVVGGTNHSSFTDLSAYSSPLWRGLTGDDGSEALVAATTGDLIAAFVSAPLAGATEWQRSWRGTLPSDASRARRDRPAAADRRASSQTEREHHGPGPDDHRGHEIAYGGAVRTGHPASVMATTAVMTA